MSAALRWALIGSALLHAALLLLKIAALSPPPATSRILSVQLNQVQAKTPVLRSPKRGVIKSAQVQQGSMRADHRKTSVSQLARTTLTASKPSAEVSIINQPLNLNVAKAIAIPPERQTLLQYKSHPNLVAETQEVETALTQQLNKAVPPDCKRAYSATGLLAIPMLMKDAITDKGCQW